MPPSAPLAALASGSPDASQILDRFLAFTAGQGLTLYPAQEEAILELAEGKHVVLSTPTGSGKSLVAQALHFQALAAGRRSVYTAPIKALVNEKFFQLCDLFGPENVGMATGDASINKGAPILCCTAEILANTVLREADPGYDAVVMDEFHYYADRERGAAWQIPLLLLEKTQFLLMSATLGDTSAIERSLEEVTRRPAARVHGALRPVPLEFEYAETPLHETIARLVEQQRAPVYLVNFTQRAAAERAQDLMSVNFSSKEEKAAIAAAIDALGVRFDSPFGKDLARYVRHGIGLHHAGLLPKYRLLVEKLSQQGLLKVISGTDTLGVGVNIPLRTVLFTQLCKFSGEKTALLTARDFHQIAGRAGRKGFDDRGYVVAQAPEHVIENKKLLEKKAAGKKVVLQKPPDKGFVHWDAQTFERLQSKLPEPLESRFQVTHGMLLNCLQASTREPGRGYGRLVKLVMRSHETDHARYQHLKKARQIFKSLSGAGIVELVTDETAPYPYPRVHEGLQRDFSIHHTLAMWLLEALKELDRASETYALDLVTMVEAILENPDAVLWKQVDKAKTEKLAELKAQGVEYDERMAELEKVEHPKPLADFIYPHFNAFAAKHPWVGTENIRPKSVFREMAERYTSFADYVRDYGLQRSEGVLLRYLSEVYKTLAQTVPEAYRDDAVDDLLMQLRLMLRAVDSSLLDEWERMKDPGAVVLVAKREIVPGRPRDPLADRKIFAARVRAELHRLAAAFAKKEWEEAARLAGPAWTPQGIEAELAPWFAEHRSIDLRPVSRRPAHTTLDETAPRQFTVRQRLFDPEEPPEEALWMIEGRVDLTQARADDDAPLVQVTRVGT